MLNNEIIPFDLLLNALYFIEDGIQLMAELD